MMPTRGDHRLSITLASGIYDITYPLITGLVDVEGIKLNVLAEFPSVDQIFRRMLRLEFDASEMGVSHYLLARDRGIPMVAIPVFLNRLFPHSYLYRSRKSRIRGPEDLPGKKFGLPQYQVSRAMWVRGILEDEYGIDRKSVTWVTEFPERMEVELPPNITVEKVAKGKTVTDLLAEGSLDAAMCWSRPLSDNIEPFFPDTKAEELRYFEKTGIFPIMHTVVIKQDLVERHPWLVRCLTEAYSRSKNLWYQWRNRINGGSMPFAKYALREQNSVLGEDPFPFGDVDTCFRVLETAARYSAADHFIKPVKDLRHLWVEA